MSDTASENLPQASEAGTPVAAGDPATASRGGGGFDLSTITNILKQGDVALALGVTAILVVDRKSVV